MITVILLLAALMLPGISSARERARRVRCLSNLRNIAIVSKLYASDNDGRLILARNRAVQVSVNPPERDLWEMVGLPIDTNKVGTASIWTCPNRPGFPTFELGFPQFNIGYQYFGGITTWRNPAGSFPSRSPNTTFQAQPHWALAADAMIKVEGVWGGGRDPAFKDMPQHRTARARSGPPEGGHEVFMDGSGRWIDFSQTLYLHTWWGDWDNRICFFYQEDIGAVEPYRSQLTPQVWGQ